MSRRVKTIKNLSAFLLAVFMTAELLFGNSVTAAASASELAAGILSAYPELSAVSSGSEVTVSGTVTNVRTALELNVPANLTVNWGAVFSGAPTRSSYILNLTGSGVFNLTENGFISNSGVGGALNVSGKGANVNITGGRLSSNTTSGAAVNVVADGVTVNVTSTGIVENLGAGSAVNITANVLNTVVNVAGGRVSSIPNGYAINDGGMTVCGNNTRITVSDGGVVEAGTACAIRSTGAESKVDVKSGIVTNYAASNSNPTVYMNGGTGLNVTVGGNSVVKTTNTASNISYVIQTTGNVLVKDNAQVIAAAGRAINLVGMDSVATIEGGVVTATTGTAISTATTNAATVANSKIIIRGGVVSATEASGIAIRVTGANSAVDISGGRVTATTGNAVRVEGTGRVKISGGFVLAWGNMQSSVISTSPSNPANVSITSDAMVAAWNTTTGTGVYKEGTDTALAVFPVAAAQTVFWHNNGVTGGIYYAKGTNKGFFPLNVVVTFDPNEHALIFNVADGKFYTDVNDTGLPTDNPLYNGQSDAWNWDSDTGVLDLDGFIWATSASRALIILGDLAIDLKGKNTFISTASGGESYGIQGAGDVIFTGDGILSATAKAYGIEINSLTLNGGLINSTATDPNQGAGLKTMNFTVNDGEITAVGGNAIIYENFTPPTAYGYKISANPDGSGAEAFNIPYDGHYSYHDDDKYVMIQVHQNHSLTVENGTGSGDFPVGTLVNIIADAPPAGYIFDTWRTVNGVVFTNINSASTSLIMPEREITVTAVYKPVYTLTVIGGTIFGGSSSGIYPVGAEVQIVSFSAPPSGNVFSGWTGGGSGRFSFSNSMLTTFTMPAENVTVVGNYRYVANVTGSFSLTVVGGTGSGEYSPAAQISISADQPSEGQEFAGWTTETGNLGVFADASNPETLFTMSAGNATVTANYRDIKYPLFVVNGTDITSAGSYTFGQTVSLSADIPLEGMEFIKWTANDGGMFTEPRSVETEFVMPSNPATVAAEFDYIRYKLTVVNGTDMVNAGSYIMGSTVSVLARDATEPNQNLDFRTTEINGDVFVKWTTDNGGRFANELSPNSAFVMPASDVTITAEFAPRYRLVTEGGGISSPATRTRGYGYFAEGTEVVVTEHLSAAERFGRWIIVEGGGGISNPNAVITTYIMPANTAIIKAESEETGSTPITPSSQVSRNPHTLNVLNGSGSGSYYSGNYVPVKANQPPQGKIFGSWQITKGHGWFENADSPQTEFIMADDDAEITAVYTDVFTLTVEHGSGSGKFPADTMEKIIADPAPDGMVFSGWTSDSGGEFFNALDMMTKYRMPDHDATVTAHYEHVSSPNLAQIPDSPNNDSNPVPPDAGENLPVNTAPPATTPESQNQNPKTRAYGTFPAVLTLTALLYIGIFLLPRRNRKGFRK
ncbi:MAG: hypothetical protein FWH08_07190 [Oscillospiraceae bacterium]|nr:hypothetical protein [Oscillospiraceae bacterium]